MITKSTGRKVVVLDAEPVVRSAVAAILKRHGYFVTATENVQLAIEVCKVDRPDLVLTNVFLPGITGHEAMKLIKESCPEVPVLMISGLPDSEVIQDWIKQDGFDAFPKPFTAQDLIAKIEQVLAH